MRYSPVVENVFYLLWGILVAAFIITGGWFIGSAVAHSNEAEHQREITCIHEGGHMERVDANSGLVCRK